jgi:prevent-host-death family protein
MKQSARTMALRAVKARLSEAVDAAQDGYVLITRHGRPAAVLVGVEGLDLTEWPALSAALTAAAARVRRP